MEFTIDGTVAQSARLVFDRSDFAWATKGAIIAYTAGLRWNVRMPGGLTGGLKTRALR